MKSNIKYKKVRTKGDNDCDECVFSLKCINPCRLEAHYHYEEEEQ